METVKIMTDTTKTEVTYSVNGIDEDWIQTHTTTLLLVLAKRDWDTRSQCNEWFHWSFGDKEFKWNLLTDKVFMRVI
jgi:hypothetical protein